MAHKMWNGIEQKTRWNEQTMRNRFREKYDE